MIIFRFSMFLILIIGECMHAQSLQLYVTLHECMDCSLPGSSVHGIIQARILEWVAMPSFRRSSQSRDETWTHVSCGSCTADGFFTAEPPEEPYWVRVGSSNLLLWLWVCLFPHLILSVLSLCILKLCY